jgi:uncharacterized protein YjeT (DUF2065 family)
MFRRPSCDALILAIGLVAAVPGPLLIQAAAQGAKRAELKIDLGEDRMISNKALTVSVRKELTPELRRQIAQAMSNYPDATVRLTLGGVIPPAERKSIQGFRVFLNKPDATAATDLDDPHFVKSVAFSPTVDTPQAFTIDILKTIVALKKSEQFDILNPKKPLKFTIVAIPASGAAQVTDDDSFSVRNLAITIPKSKKD